MKKLEFEQEEVDNKSQIKISDKKVKELRIFIFAENKNLTICRVK